MARPAPARERAGKGTHPQLGLQLGANLTRETGQSVIRRGVALWSPNPKGVLELGSDGRWMDPLEHGQGSISLQGDFIAIRSTGETGRNDAAPSPRFDSAQAHRAIESVPSGTGQP